MIFNGGSMRFIVKNIFGFLALAGIFFLTGCATSRYDNVKPVQAVPAMTSGARVVQFERPSVGPVLKGYGSIEDGVRLKGVVLSCAEGAAVRAAEAGSVAYVNESLPGYGKTLILDHEQGYSTVYARNAELLVSVGQLVRRGDTIAKSGRDGKGGSAQVYFEIRKGSKTLDPLPFLST